MIVVRCDRINNRMTLFPTHIKLNGQLTAVADLFQKKEEVDGWEKEWLEFLGEWYSPVNYIEVKTSGSTGESKTVRLKKDFVAASAQRTIDYFLLHENDRVLHCLPSRYIAGKLMIVRALIGELDLHVVDPSTDFLSMQAEHFKFAAMVPNQVAKFLDLEPETWNLEFLLIGGAAVPQPIESRLLDLPIKCYSSYSMTETATHIALRQINGALADGYYHCLDEIRVELAEDGCLQIFMPGLDEQPLKTTDLAELKDDQTFKILGRADNIIISGGMKFSPEQLEKKLEQHISFPFMISSLPHDVLGRQLVLVIETDENPQALAQLLSICKQKLGHYELPRRIQFVKQIPRTPNGKLKRN